MNYLKRFEKGTSHKMAKGILNVKNYITENNILYMIYTLNDIPTEYKNKYVNIISSIYKYQKKHNINISDEAALSTNNLLKVIVNINNREELIEVEDLKSASKLVRKLIEENNLGASEWYLSPQTGYVYEGEKLIARVSYNGRVWSISEDHRELDIEIQI